MSRRFRTVLVLAGLLSAGGAKADVITVSSGLPLAAPSASPSVLTLAGFDGTLGSLTSAELFLNYSSSSNFRVANSPGLATYTLSAGIDFGSDNTDLNALLNTKDFVSTVSFRLSLPDWGTTMASQSVSFRLALDSILPALTGASPMSVSCSTISDITSTASMTSTIDNLVSCGASITYNYTPVPVVVQPVTVPEPSAAWLAFLALGGAALPRARRQRRAGA